MSLFGHHITPILFLVAGYFLGKKKSGKAISGASNSSTSAQQSDSGTSASDGIGQETSDQQHQHKDPGASSSLILPEQSDCGPSASVDVTKEELNIVSNKQQPVNFCSLSLSLSLSARQHKDPGASSSLILSEQRDCGPSASVDVTKGEFNIVINQQQQSNGKSTLRKADDFSSSITPTPSLESDNYLVFLSFRGPDTRKKFGDHLYQGLIDAGISTFRDNEELPKGEDFGPNIFHAIKNSKISIPVLSQNYASSRWCLQELTVMVELMKSGKQTILPIFYEVEPSDLKYPKGSYERIFSVLSGKYGKEAVDKWRKALNEAANLHGWNSRIEANGHEGKLVTLVVTRVWSELKKAFDLIVADPVGIDTAVEDVLRFLDNPNATKIISIHGMGGIGKTTLAKVVYNKLLDQFQHHSYIADIRNNPILISQNKLINDLLRTKQQVSNTDEGENCLARTCTNKKVLILLDNVDCEAQLKHLVGKHDWFGVGSKIIITTRIKSILTDDGVNHNYELKEIDKGQALILFSRHAFRENSPPPNFASLSDDIISVTKGLPLALEVIGSHLRGKDKTFWESALEKLKYVLNEKVEEKLRISYDVLEHEEKQIFLDIACFFIGTDERIASYMWKARRLHPHIGIHQLSFMSLIKIGVNHELKMHDQLRDLGKRIAGEPMEQRRLWAYDEALKDKRECEALSLDKDSSSKFMDGEIFKRLPNLHFLHLSEGNFAGNFKNSLSTLRWLKWERCLDSFEATEVHLKELLILELPGGYISQNWKGWSSIKMGGLKVLNLSGCSNLTRTPDLTKFKNLEMLILENCENLEEIHPSIRYVKCLISLNLRYCGSLGMLPEELGKLEKLEELLIDETDIREIPQMVGSLKTLSAVGCRLLTRIPSSIISLVSLSTLNLNTCKKLQELPDSFEASGKLQHLSLERCYMLTEIPSSIGKLRELVELDLSSTKIRKLPESTRKLNQLKILRVSHSEIERLPSAIGKLESLQELDASGCHKLEGEILVDNGGLSSLRTLRLGRTKISSLPENFRELSTLEHLDLLYCSELKSPLIFPSGLSSLQLTCRSDALPSLSHLTYLKKLTLHLCMSLRSIPVLPPCIWKLRVWKCPKLERLQNLPDLKSLRELELLQCYGLKELDGLGTLEFLRKLDVSTSTELSNLNDFEDLESLRYLDLQNYDGKVDLLDAIGGLGRLKSLEVLNVSARKNIRQLNLSDSKDLKQLIVNNCERLDQIYFHKDVKSLERFDTVGCKSHITGLLRRDGT